MKKAALLLVGVLLFNTNFITPMASSYEKGNELETISEKYNLYDCDFSDIPDGVTPIEISADELDEFLNSIHSEEEKLNATLENELQKKANSTTRTEYTLQSAGFKTIMYGNVTTSYTENSSKTTTTLYFTYDKNYYLLIDGLVKISTSVYNAEFSWTVDKGAHDASHTVS